MKGKVIGVYVCVFSHNSKYLLLMNSYFASGFLVSPKLGHRFSLSLVMEQN